MSLLNYVYHAAPSSHKDVLDKFRAFALARGWTIDDYQVSKDWLGPSPYSWKTGTSDFLQISSNGYGTQDIICRLHFQGTGSDPDSETCYIYGTKPGFGTPDNTKSIIPAKQDAYNYSSNYGVIGLPSGPHIGCWFFGNDKVLIAVDQVTTSFIIYWWCGSMEMFDTSQDCFACYTSNIYSGERKYYNAGSQQANWNAPWMEIKDLSGDKGSFWWDGEGRGLEIKLSSGFSAADTVSNSVSFTKLAYAVQANAFSGKRVLIKPTVFGKITSSNLWYPVGTMPLYHMVFSGLTLGEQIDYGDETYICFPNCFQTRKYGTAFRIV